MSDSEHLALLGRRTMASDDRPNLSIVRLLCLTSFMMATGLVLSTYGMITLALESYRLTPDYANLTLSALLALAGVSQLVCPLAGYVGARAVRRFARRRGRSAGPKRLLGARRLSRLASP